MDVVITQWGLDSYLVLKHQNIITSHDYWTTLRPDVELLKHAYPGDPKFGIGGFWSPANGPQGVIQDGFKMKWHNLGAGRVQLRLGVALINQRAYLCDAYVKNSPQVDQRMMARFAVRIDFIRQNKHIERGLL